MRSLPLYHVIVAYTFGHAFNHERYGAYGRAWAAYVRDPDGRRVELKIH
ncbi:MULTISPECIES: hypothetical protein [Halorussus]|nr:hypothetical protein [Halorussus vallis]USZ77395.1 hypothetical protein NGM07_08695 [Halorussus vallis]